MKSSINYICFAIMFSSLKFYVFLLKCIDLLLYWILPFILYLFMSMDNSIFNERILFNNVLMREIRKKILKNAEFQVHFVLSYRSGKEQLIKDLIADKKNVFLKMFLDPQFQPNFKIFFSHERPPHRYIVADNNLLLKEDAPRGEASDTFVVENSPVISSDYRQKFEDETKKAVVEALTPADFLVTPS